MNKMRGRVWGWNFCRFQPMVRLTGAWVLAALACAPAGTWAVPIASEPFDYTETRWTNDIPGHYDGGTGWGTNTWQVDLTQQPGHPVPQAAIFGTNDYAPYEPQMAYAWGHGGRLYRELGTPLDTTPGAKYYFCLDMYTPETANSHVSGTLGGFGISIESQAGKPGELITYTPANDTWDEPKPVELTGLYGKWHRMTAEIEFFATGSVMRAWIDASREADPHEVLCSTSTAFTDSRFYIMHWGDSGYALADNITIGTNFNQVALPLAVLGTNGALITSGEAPTTAKGTRFPTRLINYAFTNVFAITNSGAETITLTDWTTNGADAALFTAHNLPAGIAPGAVSNFSVVFLPTNEGSFTASLTFSNNSALPARIINLAGASAECFVNPSNGPYAGGYEVALWHGYNSVFTSVIVGAAAGVAPTEADVDHVNFVMPTAITSGPVNIVLQRAGDTDVTLTNKFSYDPAWFIVAPTSGPYIGGVGVSVTHGLNSVITNVVVRGVDVSTTLADTNGFTITIPALDHVGWVDFTMQRAGFADFVLTNAYHCNAAVISVAPNSGRFSGGNTVTVTHDLDRVVTNVLVAGVGVVPDSASTTNCVITMPPAALAGVVNFVLQSAGVTDFTIVNAYTYNPAGFIGYSDPDVWVDLPGLPESRFHHAAVAFSNRIHVMGGYDEWGSPRDTVYAFDGTNWTVEPALPGAMAEISAASDGAHVYLAGNNGTALLQFDGASWTTLGNLTEAREGPVMVVFSNNPVVVAGHVTNVTEFTGVAFNELAGIPGGYGVHFGAGGVLGDYLYAAGGWADGGSGAITNVWRFDGADWTGVPGLPADRVWMAHAVWRDHLYVMGGADDGLTAANTVFRFDGTNWTTSAALPQRISKGAAAVLDDALYHIGGDSADLFVTLTNVYKYTVGTAYTGISPSHGHLAGGYPVTIRGENLGDGSDVTNVTLCGISVSSIVSQSATQLVVIAGASPIMTNGDVVVYSTSFGDTVRSNAFTYIHISPWCGPFAGGNTVTLTNITALGNGADITNVTVGGIAATLIGQGTDWVRFVLGAATNAGKADIVVQSASVGDTVFTDSYTYNPPGVIGWRDPDSEWAQTVPLQYRVIRAPLVNYNNALYVIGGRLAIAGGTIYTNVCRFDGTNWTMVAGLPAAAMNLGAAVWNGAIYAAGNNSTTVYRYDGTAWTTVAALPAARINPLVCVFSNRLHVLGGGAFSNVFVYDGTNWSETVGLPDADARTAPAGGVLGNYLYVAGSDASTNAWRFDGTAWTPAPGMSVLRNWVGAAATVDRLYAVGGLANYAATRDTAYFDGINWLSGSQLPYSSSYFPGAAELNDKLYAVGGGRSNVLCMELGATHFGVASSNGATAGGYAVTIAGLNLGDGADVTNVTLCGVPATIQSQSATQIVVIAGAGVPGAGDVRVYSTSYGETIKSNAFTYSMRGMTVLGTNGAVIASDEAVSMDKGTHFGEVPCLAWRTNVFAITNSGNELLTITGFDVSNLNFEVSGIPAAVAPGAVSNFNVVYHPTVSGAHGAILEIYNNSTQATYKVNLYGMASALPAQVQLVNMTQTYDGLPKPAGVTTVPAGLTVEVRYTEAKWRMAPSGTTNPPVNAGTYRVLATVDDAVYIGWTTGQLVVAKADQTITFPAIPDQTETGVVTLSATASSGLPVTFAVTAGPGQIAGGNALSFTDTGLVTVAASQAGNTNWHSAQTSQIVRVVSHGWLSIVVTPEAGAWRVVDPPAGYAGPRSGTGNLAPIAAPPGTYTVAWDDRDGYVAPAPQSGALVAGGALVFHGVWLEVTDELPAPAGVSATAGAHTNFVRVTWHGVPGATGYEIWRNTMNDPSGAVRLADVPAGVGVRVLNPLEGERLVSRSDVRSSGVADTARVDARPPSEGMDGGAARVDARPPVESDSGTSAFSLQVSSLLHYDDYAVTQNVSYYYWVRAKTGTQISRLSYVGAGYTGLNPDQTEGTADLAVSDLVFLPVNMRPDTTVGTVSLRLKNLGPDTLTAAPVEFDFYMGMAGGEMLWIGADRQDFTLAVGVEELVILTPQAKRGIVARGDQAGVLAARVRARHLTNLRDPSLANNVTDAAGRVRVQSGVTPSRRRGLTDLDGDGKTDLLTLRGDRSQFAALMSGECFTRLHFADTGVLGAGYLPAPGDYDGDGVLDLGLYEESTGIVYAQLSGTDGLVGWAGLAGPGYVPVTGDYDGDGLSDPGLYQAATGLWIGKLSGVNYAVRYLYVGGPRHVALHADYDGDGKTDPAVYSASDARLIACLSSLNHAPVAINIGGPGWVGVKGDFDGDGMSDPAVYGETTGTWWGILSRDGRYGAPMQGVFGAPGWMPVPADYDGDGKTDPAIQSVQWNPRHGWQEGFWYGLMSSRNYAPLQGWFGGMDYGPVGE